MLKVNQINLKSPEVQRIIKYISIGLFTTLITYLIWTLLLELTKNFNLDKEIRFSGTQFIASSSTVLLSFYLNRKITFKDKTRRHSKKRITLINVAGLYLASPALASTLTYLIQIILPGIFMDEILKIIGLGAGMVINYSGQRFWIYKS